MEKNIFNECERSRIGKCCGAIGIFCNAVLFASKLVIGIYSGSLSVQADAFNNLSDAASAVIALLGFKFASKPADKEHPYGHARFEYLASLFVAVIILVIGAEFFINSIKRIIHPIKLDFSVSLLLVLIFSIGMKLFLMFYLLYMEKRIDSGLLKATAADCRNDVIVTGVIVISAVTEHITGMKVDGVMGMVVSIFIMWSGISLLKQTISQLLGEGATTELEKQIVSHVKGFPMVIDCHKLMVHDYGPGKTYASIHVQMSSDIEAILCHEIIDTIERECLEKLGIHLTIHYDPIAEKIF